MKKFTTFIFCAFIGVIFFSSPSKAQGGSAYGKHLMDSLKITDPDEVAICNLYDDAVTEYFTLMKAYMANGSKPTTAQSNELNKKFQLRQKEIQPQIESFRKRVGGNYTVAMNFAQFCSIEAMRIYGGMGIKSPYQNGGYPSYPMPKPANH